MINVKMLREDCHMKERGNTKQKTKTKTILPKLDELNYIRKPLEIMSYGSVLVTRALIMARYGMLNCGVNFSRGYGGKNCEKCGTVDDENHRINNCVTFKDINLYKCQDNLDFNQIYSDDLNSIMKVIEMILKMLDLECGRNAIWKA